VLVVAAMALVCLTANCQQRNKNKATQLRVLEAGLEYAALSVRPTGSDSPTTIHVLRLDPRRFAMTVIDAAKTGVKLADARAFRVADKAIAAVNGGYFDPEYRPLGLLVSGGRQLRRLRRVDHGVFTVADGTPRLQHARKFNKPAKLDFAVECGPRLVVDGKPLTFKPGVHRRTAIGHDRSGRVLVLATAGVLGLADLAAFMARPLASGGLGAIAALNLDGGSSTMFDLHHPSATAKVPAPVRIPIGLGVVRRPVGLPHTPTLTRSP
jgi:uncharacterized protein YigE (DUF2233 family)